MSDQKKQSLLQKYNIPIDHLDFKYIATCRNVKEMERIVEILKSGEEGFYPDLTTCAENKLKELCPNSKLLRVEEPVKRQEILDKNEFECIIDMMKDFTVNMKQTHVSSSESTNQTGDLTLGYQLPEIRKSTVSPTKSNDLSNGKTERIRSCDYSKWDKYDADTEVLKIDLTEERNREKSIDHHIKLERAKIEIIDSDIVGSLTDDERDKLAEKHRIFGNEFYRSSSYVEAIAEYSKSISFCASAAGFNNRAMAYIKTQKYAEAIADCDECLRIEPENIKALLRKAEALLKCNKAQSGYETYMQILKLQSDNQIAKKNVEDLRRRFPELAPPNAFRLNISEKADESVERTVSIQRPPTGDDLSSLIIPKKIVRSKLSQMASNWDSISKAAKADAKKLHKKFNEKREPQIMPTWHDEKWTGATIEEIFD